MKFSHDDGDNDVDDGDVGDDADHDVGYDVIDDVNNHVDDANNHIDDDVVDTHESYGYPI
jgi:hypothetical protein